MMASGDSKSPQILLHLLCAKLTGLRDEALIPYYKVALSTLGSSIYSPTECDEFEIAEKIKRKLARQSREKDAAIFSEHLRTLQSHTLLKNRWAVLYLLHRLTGEGARKLKALQTSTFSRGLGGHVTSTPFVGGVPGDSSASRTGLSTGSSGISSIQASYRSDDPSPLPQSLHPTFLQTPGVTPGGLLRPAPSTGQRILKLTNRDHTDAVPDSSLALRGQLSAASSRYPRRPHLDSSELTETMLLREIVYVFQGIEGKYIKYDVTKEAYRLEGKSGVPKAVRQVVSKLTECGWLFNKIRKYADSRSTDRAFGLVGQSFCAALHQELTEYYRLMAVLEAQLEQEEDQGVSGTSAGLTLRRLWVWTSGPATRLRALAALVDVCQGKKGGALASAIHSYIQHGDPTMRSLIKHTLTLVAQPVFSTIMRWMYDGDLEDTYHEFFVASDPTVKDDRLWHDKYSLRKSMIPSFLTMDQAKKILLTGKSINFLRQLCHDRTSIRNRDVVKAAETNQVESIYSEDLDGVFQKMIDAIYKETSSHLLEVLHTKYKFLDHLKAMRRYLLLGQGDFVRHLMDLLQEDLAKPAQTLFLHNLTGILETAIRATNAQYDDTDILKRMDVRILEVSPGDTGWDVFSLDYHMDGPIQTVFTPEIMRLYLRVFNFLWRAKRMEYILAMIWKSQMANARLLRSIPELSPILHQCHVLASEMVHFIQQVQYYINFEVLECSWDELLTKVESAEDLDHIIAAHQVFLDTIITRSLLDVQSKSILTQLRTIFDLIIQFQTKQDHIYHAAQEELSARQSFNDLKARKTDEGEWGVSDSQEREEEKRRQQFRHSQVSANKGKLTNLANSYQNMVQQFLVMLTSHSDVSLRFLSFRLDFNEHYHAKEPRLRSPLAYHKVKRRTKAAA